MSRRVRHDRMTKGTALLLPVATNRESGTTARGAGYRRMDLVEIASRAGAQGPAAVPTCAQVAYSALRIWGPTCMTIDTLRFQQPMYSCSAIRGQPQHRHVSRRPELPPSESFTFTSERLTFDPRPFQPFKGAGPLRRPFPGYAFPPHGLTFVRTAWWVIYRLSQLLYPRCPSELRLNLQEPINSAAD